MRHTVASVERIFFTDHRLRKMGLKALSEWRNLALRRGYRKDGLRRLVAGAGETLAWLWRRGAATIELRKVVSVGRINANGPPLARSLPPSIKPPPGAALSTIAAAVPVVTLLVLIASGKLKAHLAAIIALIVANVITIAIITMPANMSIRVSLLGVVVGFFPIGWIVLRPTSIRSRRWC